MRGLSDFCVHLSLNGSFPQALFDDGHDESAAVSQAIHVFGYVENASVAASFKSVPENSWRPQLQAIRIVGFHGLDYTLESRPHPKETRADACYPIEEQG